MFPWLSQDRPQLLRKVVCEGCNRALPKGSLVADILHWAPDQALKRKWRGVGGGSQFEKLKTTTSFHFLNLKQITVCGIH
jgi:hypothetical protein